MSPGETRHVAFTFDVQHQLADPEAKVELSISRRGPAREVVEKIRMPIAPAATLAAGERAREGQGERRVALRRRPTRRRGSFGKLPAGWPRRSSRTSGDWVKLALGNTASASSRGERGRQRAARRPRRSHSRSHGAPAARTSRSARPSLATRDTHTEIKGTASDTERLLDAYIFVGSRKVFYRSNRNGADPKRMGSTADLPLRPGVNVVTIIARENPDTTSRKTFIVRRDGASGELLQTPKTEDDLSESGGQSDD